LSSGRRGRAITSERERSLAGRAPSVESNTAISVDGRLVDSETLYAVAGPCVLVITSAVPNIGAELHSSYVGARGANTIVAELWRGRDGTETCVRTAGHADLSLVHQRRRCFYDHLQQLQDRLHVAVDAQVAIDVDEHALRTAERAVD
jgi:hypothetical protein